MLGPTDAVIRAHDLIAAGRNGEAAETLRNAADQDGDVAADRELGRLLSLLRPDSLPDPDDPSEAEVRLARSAPHDPSAACALINLYAGACDEIRQDFHPDNWDPVEEEWDDDQDEEKAAQLAHYRQRAAERCEQALAVDPGCGAAASAMVALINDEWQWSQEVQEALLPGALLGELASAAQRALAIDSDDPVAVAALAEASWELGDTATARRFSRRLLELDPSDELARQRLHKLGEPLPASLAPRGYEFLCLSLLALGENHGDQFDTFEEQIIVSDPVDLLWATSGTAMLKEELTAEPGRLVLYRNGRRARTWTQPEDVEILDWLREEIPQLTGPRLPHGHPVRTDSLVQRYGYSASGTDR